MFRGWVPMILLGLLGCAGQTVAQGTTPKLVPNEGLVAVIVDTNVPLVSLVFTHEDGARGFTVDNCERGVSAHLVRAPAGRYALTDFRTVTGALDAASDDARLCLQVEAGKTNYPGHFLFRDPDKGQGLRSQVEWGWRPNEGDLSARMKAGWPGLAAQYPVQLSACR